MSAGGPASGRNFCTLARAPHVPERTCVGCRERVPRAQLVRLVLAPGGVLDVDLRAAAPGRGAWIHPDPQCVARAERRRAFGRALRVSAPLDSDLVWRWLAGRLSTGPAVPPGSRPTDGKGG
ncbi:YlxR family protein [Actinomyces lilanjuaniae]|uniref:YlxR family protein n=1 Tax=Actinomyces lilanjuaniae TaxID=2321394 RepID=UPI00242D9738|nr:YlxR family protein [Actinomyces lilanjuaniae]